MPARIIKRRKRRNGPKENLPLRKAMRTLDLRRRPPSKREAPAAMQLGLHPDLQSALGRTRMSQVMCAPMHPTAEQLIAEGREDDVACRSLEFQGLLL